MNDRPSAPIVALIEADPAMRALLGEWILAAGYRSHDRAGPRLPDGADVNLVVVDLCDLPTRGAATVSRVKTMFPAAAVVGLSTQASRAIAGDALGALAPGLVALLPKPCARAELLAALERALPARTRA